MGQPGRGLAEVLEREVASNPGLVAVACSEHGGGSTVCVLRAGEYDSDSDCSTAGMLGAKQEEQDVGPGLFEAVQALVHHSRAPPNVVGALVSKQAREGPLQRIKHLSKEQVCRALLGAMEDASEDEQTLPFLASLLLSCQPQLEPLFMARVCKEDSDSNGGTDAGTPLPKRASSRYSLNSSGSLSCVWDTERGGLDVSELYMSLGTREECTKQFNQYHWTDEYYRIRAEVDASGGRDLLALSRLSDLASSFTHAASMYARVLASEYGLPHHAKSIKSVAAGGIAGGDKYKAAGIFFKFSTDSNGIYGDDELAAKAARHDLRGLNLLSRLLAGSTARVPLSCVVDCSGLSILALSLVPMAAGPPVYGSSDGGRTVHDSNPEARDLMARVGRHLNLRQHEVGGCQMALCGDVEVRQGYEDSSSLYVLDAARLMPCEPPGPQGTRGHMMARLLRPELVGRSAHALCSDAYSGWDESPPALAAEHKSHIKACFDSMFDDGIQKGVVPTLTRMAVDGTDAGSRLSVVLHSHGVNMRFLRSVYHALDSNSPWQRVVLTEMAARAVKSTLRRVHNLHTKRIRGLALSHTYDTLSRNYLELVLVRRCPRAWASLLHVLNSKFSRGTAIGDDWCEEVDLEMIFLRVITLTGAKRPLGAESGLVVPLKQRIATLRDFGFVTHHLDVVEVSRVMQAVAMANSDLQPFQRMVLLEPLLEAARTWTDGMLKQFGQAIPSSLLDLCQLQGERGRVVEAVTSYREAARVRDIVYPRDGPMSSETAAQSIREIEVGVRLEAALYDNIGYSVQTSNLHDFMQERVRIARERELKGVNVNLESLPSHKNMEGRYLEDCKAVRSIMTQFRYTPGNLLGALTSQDFDRLRDITLHSPSCYVAGAASSNLCLALWNNINSVTHITPAVMLSNIERYRWVLEEVAANPFHREMDDLGLSFLANGVCGIPVMYWTELGQLEFAEVLLEKWREKVYQKVFKFSNNERLEAELRSHFFLTHMHFLSFLYLRTAAETVAMSSFALHTSILSSIPEDAESHESFRLVLDVAIAWRSFLISPSEVRALACRQAGIKAMQKDDLHFGFSVVLLSLATIEVFLGNAEYLGNVVARLEVEMGMGYGCLWRDNEYAAMKVLLAFMHSDGGSGAVSTAWRGLKCAYESARENHLQMSEFRICIHLLEFAVKQSSSGSSEFFCDGEPCVERARTWLSQSLKRMEKQMFMNGSLLVKKARTLLCQDLVFQRPGLTTSGSALN